MKKLLLLSTPLLAILPIPTLISCATNQTNKETPADQNQDFPTIDADGNGFSSIDPKDILGNSLNLTLAEIEDIIIAKPTWEQEIEIDKIKTQITSTKANGVELNTINKNNYKKYFSLNPTDENSILLAELSQGFKIETHYDFYDDTTTSISVVYALFQDNHNNQPFYIGEVNIDGFTSSKQKEYSGTDKEKSQAKFEDEIEWLEKITNANLNLPKWLIESTLGNNTNYNFSKLYNLLDLEKNPIVKTTTFFAKENNQLNFVIGAKIAIMKSIAQVKKMFIELKYYWIDRGEFDQKGDFVKNFVKPKLKSLDTSKDYEVDWTSSSVDQKYRADFEAKVQKFNVAIKKSSATIYSMPIEFKPVVTKEVILKADKSWPIDKGVAFNKLTTADKLAWFKFADNANLANYYLDVIFDNQSNSFNFTIKYEIKKVGKNTYYTIDGSTEIPSQKLTKLNQ